MSRMKIVIPALALLIVAGCDSKPSDSAIDMGPAAAQPAAEDGNSSQAQAVADVSELVRIPAGEGVVEHVIESCNVEQVNGQAFAGSPLQVPSASAVTIDGWVVADDPTTTVELRLINQADASTYSATARTDVARDDVAAAFHADPAVVKPGFHVTLDAAEIPAGDYHLQVVVPSTEHGPVVCDNGRVISLSN